MSMTPPTHICGQMKNTFPLEIRQERLAWVHAAHRVGISNVQIARMLGVTPSLVRKLLRCDPPRLSAQVPQPLTYTRTSSPFSHREAPVTLARAPWDGATATPDTRPETAPPRGIQGHQQRMTPQEVIEAIRREWIKGRAAA